MQEIGALDSEPHEAQSEADDVDNLRLMEALLGLSDGLFTGTGGHGGGESMFFAFYNGSLTRGLKIMYKIHFKTEAKK